MAIAEASKNSEIAIFVRLITAEMGDMSPELAQFILALGFDDDDEARMRELSEKSQRGSLTSEGQADIRSSSTPGVRSPCCIRKQGNLSRRSRLLGKRKFPDLLH